jgi:queuine tRNA-ribosyltransferase
VYFNITNELNWEQLDQWSHKPRYVMGYFEPELLQTLKAKGIEFIETDEPAQAAMQGIVYSSEGHINLTNSETAVHFEPIDKACTCPTCSKQLTKAYLHHLLTHTPLLCQRLLIQHNVFYAMNSSTIKLSEHLVK